jgi:hypothetical protein
MGHGSRKALSGGACVTKLPSLSLMETDSVFTPLMGDSQLSNEGQELLGGFFIGIKARNKGYLRATMTNSQNQAALDLLILEQAGNTLTSSDAARITRDSVTGQPFVFDPAKRELVAPPSSAALNVEPLVLPW